MGTICCECDIDLCCKRKYPNHKMWTLSFATQPIQTQKTLIKQRRLSGKSDSSLFVHVYTISQLCCIDLEFSMILIE